MRHEIDMTDDEYMTPAQRAELRRTMTELPLWQEMELAKQATINVEPHAIDCFSTEAPKVDADTVEATGGVIGGDYDAIERLLELMRRDGEISSLEWEHRITEHRTLNGTQGQESEE